MMQIDFFRNGSRQAMLALKLQAGGSEVEKQTIISIGRDEIIHQLDFVDLREAGRGLQFANQVIVNNKVGDEIPDNHVLVTHLNVLRDFDG